MESSLKPGNRVENYLPPKVINHSKTVDIVVKCRFISYFDGLEALGCRRRNLEVEPWSLCLTENFEFHQKPLIAQLVERETVTSQISLGHLFESG